VFQSLISIVPLYKPVVIVPFASNTILLIFLPSTSLLSLFFVLLSFIDAFDATPYMLELTSMQVGIDIPLICDN